MNIKFISHIINNNLMIDFKNVGLRIRKTRIERGLEIKELAEKVEKSREYVSMIERNGKNFSIELLFNFCKALEVDANYLLVGEVALIEEYENMKEEIKNLKVRNSTLLDVIKN